MEALERISQGFTEAKILLTAAELRIFDHLKGGRRTAAEVRAAVAGNQRGVEILLDALTAMGILSKDEGTYRIRPEYEPHLTEEAPDHFPSLLRHRNLMFRRWAFLEEIVRGAPLPEVVAGRAQLQDPQANENFIRAMYTVAHRSAPPTADRIDLEGVRTLADLGGGPGHFLAEFLRRSPEIEGYLVDLPRTLEVSRRVLRDHPLRERIRLVAWDIYDEAPPADLPPIDLAFLSQVVHGESDARNRELFRRLLPVVSPGGRLVVRENVANPDRVSPPWAALFAVNMLAMTEGGRTYTEEEIASWGKSAGFQFESGERLDERSYLVHLRRPR